MKCTIKQIKQSLANLASESDGWLYNNKFFWVEAIKGSSKRGKILKNVILIRQ